MAIRTFIAVDLNAPLRDALSQIQDHLQSDLPRIAWVRPQSLHLTLKFLGNVEEAQLAPIHDAVVEVVREFHEFSLTVEGLGVFPDLRLPRVLWTGICGEVESLIALVKKLEDALIPLGFLPESKPFRPHLTIARIKEHSHRVGKILESTGLLSEIKKYGDITVNQVILFKSELKPSGAVYTPLWHVRLGAEG